MHAYSEHATLTHLSGCGKVARVWLGLWPSMATRGAGEGEASPVLGARGAEPWTAGSPPHFTDAEKRSSDPGSLAAGERGSRVGRRVLVWGWATFRPVAFCFLPEGRC